MNRSQLTERSLTTYESTTGHSVTFTPATRDLNTFPIAALDGKSFDRETKRWPFLQGSVMTSSGDGLIVIQNDRRHEKIILDDRHLLRPVRTQTAF